MPELPDIVVYLEALERRIVGKRIEAIRVASPSLLRSAAPPLQSAAGKRVLQLRRMGKRICIGLEGDLWLILHLMIAGRLHWRERGAKLARPRGLAAFDFPDATLLWTEAGSQKRASLYVIAGEENLRSLDPGGLEVLNASLEQFTATLTSANHTLKRALTDPHLLAGIGNAYSDEILHRAHLSPIALTAKLEPDEWSRLFAATRAVLTEWIERLRAQTGGEFPEGVTAFRPEMAVHGRFGKPCLVCGSPVQRIVYAENECNYCARCQTGGIILADRALSRLLHKSWPRSIDALE